MVTRRPPTVVALALVVGLSLGGLLRGRLSTDNGFDAWLPKDDTTRVDYARFRATFGEDRFVLALSGPLALASAADRAALAAVQAALADEPGVASVDGPLTDDGRRARDPRRAALASADGRTAALLVWPDAALDRAGRAALLARLRTRLATAPVGRPFALVGPEAINHALDDSSQTAFARLFPAAIAVLACVLGWQLGSLRLAAALLLVGSLATVGTLAALVLAGRTLNMVLVVLPPLVLILSTAYGLHLIGHVEAARGPVAARWRKARGRVLRPALLTALTTGAGFVALRWAGLPPLVDLGWLAATGVGLSFALTLALLPALALTLGATPARRPTNGAAVGAAPRPWIRPVVLASGLLVAVAAAVGVSRLRVESQVLHLFPAAHPLVTAHRRAEARLIGLTPLELWIGGPRRVLLAPPAQAALRELEARCRALPETTAWLSPLSSTAPPSPLLLAALAGGHGPLPAGLGRYLRLDGERLELRVTLAMRTVANERLTAIAAQIGGWLRELTPAGAQARLTGAVAIVARLQVLLLRGQLWTFGASLALVSLLLGVGLGSARLAALSLVPNLLPVLATLGLMGALAIPLDVATVTVAGIAFGLVVDDTIHLLHRYQHARQAGQTLERAVATMLHEAGRAVRVSSLAIAIGFGVFALSPFPPTRYFGLLIAFCAACAVLCDLWLLPTLMLTRRSR